MKLVMLIVSLKKDKSHKIDIFNVILTFAERADMLSEVINSCAIVLKSSAHMADKTGPRSTPFLTSKTVINLAGSQNSSLSAVSLSAMLKK